MVRIVTWLFLTLAITPVCSAGVWLFVEAQGSPGAPPLNGIVHPPGYTGAGGQLTVRVCVSPSDPQLVPSLQGALATWNNLTPMTGNCQMCKRVEDISQTPPFGPHLESLILHELGHCAMGLAHINLPLSGVPTSFTNSVDASSMNVGPDGVRGSSDDRPSPLPGTRLIHWFRIADNNPVIIDSTVIDEDTFTRALSSLPLGHVWATSANADYRFPGDNTSELLGFPNTQAVMYSFQNEELRYTGLSADDVNTLKMARTGLDKQAGTSDDYMSTLVFEPDCAQAQIEVRLVDPFIDPDLVPGVLGRCVAEVTAIPDPPNPTQHFFVSPKTGNSKIIIKINGNVIWDIYVVFHDGFESGDTSDWSATVP